MITPEIADNGDAPVEPRWNKVLDRMLDAAYALETDD